MQRIFALALVCLMAGSAPAQTTFFSETFDAVTAPALPASVLAADASWSTSSASSSPGSGLNNGVHTGSSPGVLVLGPIDLSAALDGTFSYWARRTSSYSADSLFVCAGTDGATFGEMLFGGGLPAASSSWEQISVVMPAALIGEGTVYLQFEGRGGSSSGSNMRIDDVLIEGTMDPSAIQTSFGFGKSAMTWDLEGDLLNVGLDLAFPGPDSMQGLQFDLSWDDAVISVDSVSLGAIAGPSSGWFVSSSFGAGSGSVALVNAGTGLPPGPYADFLQLHLSAVAPVSATTTLSMSGVLATTNTASATELPLPDGLRSVAITLQPSQASALFSLETIDFGSVTAADSAVVQVTVSNPTGSAPLELAWSSPGPIPLNPIPTLPASIPVGQSGVIDLWLKPRLVDGGQQSGTITISHNTAAASTDLSWVAVVIGGRGDADGDGAFDVADVVVSLDGTVNPASVPADELPRHDVFPFPDGDGALDIRDITVAIQAILRSQWPDGSSLPVSPGGAAGKGASIPLVLAGDSLWVASPVALRGIQLELRASSGLTVAAKGGSASIWSDLSTGTHRLISLAGAGAEFDAGYTLVAVLNRPGPLDSGNNPVSDMPNDAPMPPSSHFESTNTSIALLAGMAVDAYGSKIPLALEIVDDLPALPQPELGSFGVYPNPLPLGNRLHLDLPIAAITGIELFDTLGRRVWHANEPSRSIPSDILRTPGTYFIRLQSEGKSVTRSVVVFR